MIIRPNFGPGSRGGTPLPEQADMGATYSRLSDEQLIAERDRQRRRLDELTASPGGSAGICELLVSIDHDVEQMTEELTRRARS